MAKLHPALHKSSQGNNLEYKNYSNPFPSWLQDGFFSILTNFDVWLEIFKA